MQVAGSSALVTGGASGLGAATVRRLAGAGANVVIADVREDTGEALAGELGERALFAKTDVTDADSMGQAVQTAVARFGGVHILVNCAGIGIAERVLGRNGPHDLAAFNRVIQVNLIGSFNALRLAAAVMAENAP
ncbi:MAG TPA: SDR family NAD(P)-dependent oxidoreductase, partial [Ktedonobacterales bacterium]|nr:SDR family NAD(P)-dependent oxidoreductase [Ktedonobacterales bacterium]